MKQDYEAAYRAILSGLIGSKLTSKELERVARQALRDPEFWMLIARGLQNYIEATETGWLVEQSELLLSDEETKTGNALTNIIEEKVISRRLSKNIFLGMIGSISRRFASDSGLKKLTVRQILRQFMTQASGEEIAMLSSRLGVNTAQDAYLIGIDKKSRSSR